ncbi:restriction endonuclease subunit S [Bifidobacterium adolescentis]|nr:restriction endonuclease subunit S [Bifidobacterium adolescentis]KAB5798661.1 restriction endonuclease subunit S [Bifidobacterium adolescentis]KAB5812482.1 restriction endonuclease subunit S [Bifidobacterium adolescentis]
MPAIWRAWKSSKHCSGVNDMAEQHGKALVPQIRFAGFTDPWEQRKLGELYKEVSEKNDLTYGRDRIISVAHMYFNPVVYVTEDDYLKTYNVMRLGDIAFEGNRSKNFTHGRLVENTIGDGIVSHVFKVFRPIRPFDLMYWKYSINNEKAMKDVLTRSTKASTMMHELVAKDFLNEEIAVPSLEEQRQIGAFFDRLDSLITLHQRKYDKLCVLKKSMLDKMFPKGGSLYPEIRFAGFTDPWEQRKLGEVATFGGGHTPSMSDSDNYEGGNVLWVTSQDVKSHYLDGTTTQITEKGAKELTLYPAGSLVMVTRSGILRHTLPVAELRKPSTVNQDIRVILPQENYYGQWLLQFFISRNKELLLEFGKTGTTVESVDFSKMRDMVLLTPSLPEQQQIGRYFARLDNLITLHQRKLELLRNIKKSMLDKMFV